ncbi:hypothetical protein INR49_018459 [Caranx melampygus]|nr:hypothetical protein INR49_018459 [Caranx melampygus]
MNPPALPLRPWSRCCRALERCHGRETDRLYFLNYSLNVVRSHSPCQFFSCTNLPVSVSEVD